MMYSWSDKLYLVTVHAHAEFVFGFMRGIYFSPWMLQVDIPSCFVGLVLENCELPYPSHGHVVLADPSPVLLYPISSTEVRCLVDVPGKKIPSITSGEMAKHLRTVVAPQVFYHDIFFLLLSSSRTSLLLSCIRPDKFILLQVSI